MFTIKMPSLAIVSPLLLLHAFNMGVDGIALIHDEENCSSKMSVESLNKTVRFVQQLLDRWGIDKNRIRYINKANNPKVNDDLHKFVDMMTRLHDIRRYVQLGRYDQGNGRKAAGVRKKRVSWRICAFRYFRYRSNTLYRMQYLRTELPYRRNINSNI
jgi:coenzyme F420-reducing hydrogenase delta subunit